MVHAIRQVVPLPDRQDTSQQLCRLLHWCLETRSLNGRMNGLVFVIFWYPSCAILVVRILRSLGTVLRVLSSNMSLSLSVWILLADCHCPFLVNPFSGADFMSLSGTDLGIYVSQNKFTKYSASHLLIASCDASYSKIAWKTDSRFFSPDWRHDFEFVLLQSESPSFDPEDRFWLGPRFP